MSRGESKAHAYLYIYMRGRTYPTDHTTPFPINHQAPTDAIGVLCHPQQVAPGQGFTLSLWFTQTHPRESDIIVVALVRRARVWFVCGDWVRVRAWVESDRPISPFGNMA